MSATPLESAPSPTLCLCMMVCNEAHVVRRALRSIRDHIDFWVICDNGSTDGTLPEIVNTLSGIPGQLHRTTWVNFGHNRQRSLRLAQGKADYILIMDADMVAHVHAPFKHKLTADGYLIRYEGDTDYCQRLLVASRVPWTYVGATHEYITAPDAGPPERLHELTLTHFGDGGMRAAKFQRDEALLRRAIAADPHDPRSVFYLAQTYFDLGRYAEALPVYRQRSQMPGWDEETWFSLLRTAECLDKLGHPWPSVAEAYAEAFNFRPSRLEPLYRIVRRLRLADDCERGYQAGLLGVPLPYPEDCLFIDRAIHQFAFLLEFALCAARAEHPEQARAALDRVLAFPGLPEWAAEDARRTLAALPASSPAPASARPPTLASTRPEFFQFAAALEHDSALLARGEEVVTYCRSEAIESVRLIASHATPEERARRKLTFYHPAIAARRHLGQGRHDLEEALTFAGANRDPNDRRSYGTHLPIHVKKLSVIEKRLSAGERWDVSVRGDRWGLHPMEDLYLLLNIGTLILERDAELVVQGNILSLLCQCAVCAPGSRIAILPTPFSVDNGKGPHDGESGATGPAGEAGTPGLPLRLGGSILGPCLPPDPIGPLDVAALNARAGGQGGNGLRGADGRNGGMAKIAELTFRSLEGELIVFAKPGDGGRGGDGGDGGAGGKGGDGADGRNLLSGRIPAGAGGDGGLGGNGGRGGHGGNGGLCSSIYVSVPPSQAHRIRRIALPGLGGQAGTGGAGGAGGEPGQGGLEPPTLSPVPAPESARSATSIGPRAPSGRPGANGNPGRSGANGRNRPAPWIFLNDQAESPQDSPGTQSRVPSENPQKIKEEQAC